jgi:NADH-quinone oxidoreductase subunit M
MSPHFPLLTVLTFLPFAGGLAIFAIGRLGRSAARLTALLFAIAAVTITIFAWLHFQPTAGLQFEEVYAWESSIGLTYHLGIDGLSLLLLAVSSIVVLMAVAASWSNEKQGPAYFGLLLFLETGLFGTFTALNFLHWFLYWELSLIPAFFLVRIYGGPGRARAATQFFVYTMVGSIALLLSFLAIFLATGSFDFVDLSRMAQNGQLTAAIAQNLHWHDWDAGHISMALFCAAFLGFAIKTPVVPFHGWLAATYAEAAPETTMVLTGALSKMGIYGFLRILLPIFPEQMWRARNVLLWLAIASIVLPAFAAWAQKDLKRMFAYGSINHLGYCTLAIAAVAASSSGDPMHVHEKAAALTGAMLQLFSHGVTAAALFWFLALLARRSGGLTGLEDFGGIRARMPVFAGLMGIAIFASLGLPGLIGFPGEFLIFKGVFSLDWQAASLALPGLMMTAVFLLTAIQRVFSGPLHERARSMPDLTGPEQWMLAPVILLLFVVGLYPQVIGGMIHGTVMQLVGLVRY